MNLYRTKKFLTLFFALILVSIFIRVSVGADEHNTSDTREHHEHGHKTIVNLSSQEMKEFGIKLATAQTGELSVTLSLTGEIVFNPDRVVHITPRVPGVARQIYKSVGDPVSENELLAVLDSGQLAHVKSKYLAALARYAMAQTNHQREEQLWKQKISAERVYLESKQILEEAQIAKQLAERQLYALDLSENDVVGLSQQPQTKLTRYRLTSPMTGTVIERHLVRGEVVSEGRNEATFIVADLRSVWGKPHRTPKGLRSGEQRPTGKSCIRPQRIHNHRTNRIRQPCH